MGGFLLQETELDIFISISLRMRRVHSTWKAVIIWTVCSCFVVRTIYYMVFEIAPPPLRLNMNCWVTSEIYVLCSVMFYLYVDCWKEKHYYKMRYKKRFETVNLFMTCIFQVWFYILRYQNLHVLKICIKLQSKVDLVAKFKNI